MFSDYKNHEEIIGLSSIIEQQYYLPEVIGIRAKINPQVE